MWFDHFSFCTAGLCHCLQHFDVKAERGHGAGKVTSCSGDHVVRHLLAYQHFSAVPIVGKNRLAGDDLPLDPWVLWPLAPVIAMAGKEIQDCPTTTTTV